MDWVAVESTNLAAVAFEPSNPLSEEPLARGVLSVKFQNGDVYRYLNVPRDVYEALLGAPSKGVFFNTVIKHTYVSVKQGEDAPPNREITVAHLKNVAEGFMVADREINYLLPPDDESYRYIRVTDTLAKNITELLNDAVRLLEQ